MLKRHSAKRLEGIIFTLPALVCIIILTAYPIYEIFRLSFSRVELATFVTEFVGFTNFKKIFASQVFWQTSKNMVIWVSVYVPAHFLLGLLTALALNRKIKWIGKPLRVIIFLPWTLALVSIALSWTWLLHAEYGLLNSFLKRAGLANLAQRWLSDPSLALYSLMLVNTWYLYPFVTLVLLAGLQTVPEDLISAARVDGANRLQIFFHVMLPCLEMVLGLAFILSLIYALQAFTTIWIMTGGGPANFTEMFSTFIYRHMFLFLDISTAAAMSVILFVITSIVIIPYVYLSTKEA